MNNRRSRRHFLGAAATLIASGFTAARSESKFSSDLLKENRLARPIPLEADGKPLVREGYESLYPFVGDFDGDGRQSLLLGTHGGRLLIYRNAGTKTNPRLTSPQWFDDAVPTGRIPAG
jgi:hypothetical protein